MRKRRFWQFISAFSEIFVIISILLISIFIIFIFDNNPLQGLFLLPEWGAIAFFTTLDALRKQLKVVRSQDNYESRQATSLNLLQWQMLVSFVCFVICFMCSRGYISLSPGYATDIVEQMNWVVLIFSLLQNMSASMQLDELNYQNERES